MELERISVPANELNDGDVIERTTDKDKVYYFIDAEPYYDIERHRWHCWIKKISWEQVEEFFSDESNDYVATYFPDVIMEDWDIENGRNYVSVLALKN